MRNLCQARLRSRQQPGRGVHALGRQIVHHRFPDNGAKPAGEYGTRQADRTGERCHRPGRGRPPMHERQGVSDRRVREPVKPAGAICGGIGDMVANRLHEQHIGEPFGNRLKPWPVGRQFIDQETERAFEPGRSPAHAAAHMDDGRKGFQQRIASAIAERKNTGDDAGDCAIASKPQMLEPLDTQPRAPGAVDAVRLQHLSEWRARRIPIGQEQMGIARRQDRQITGTKFDAAGFRFEQAAAFDHDVEWRAADSAFADSPRRAKLRHTEHGAFEPQIAQWIINDQGRAGWFGVTCVDFDGLANAGGLHTQGALVAAIESGSPSDVAGLTQGDIILQVNDIVVTDAATFSGLVRHLGPGDHVRLRVLRNGEPLRLAAMVVEAKAS